MLRNRCQRCYVTGRMVRHRRGGLDHL